MCPDAELTVYRQLATGSRRPGTRQLAYHRFEKVQQLDQVGLDRQVYQETPGWTWSKRAGYRVRQGRRLEQVEAGENSALCRSG